MIRIGLLGSRGRMGQWVIRLIEQEFAKQASVSAMIDRGDEIDPLLQSDVVIDFSLPEAMTEVAAACAGRDPKTLPAFVIGSTGWKLDQRRELEALAKKTPVLLSSNFSTGVQAFLHIMRQVSPMLEKLGYTPVIREAHHRHKKDSPSGTAVSLQRAIAPAGPGNVQTHCVRAGEVIGDHEVTFYGPGDRISFGHFAQDRSIFARGAVEVALWMAEKRTQGQGIGGLIGMETFFQEKFL